MPTWKRYIFIIFIQTILFVVFYYLAIISLNFDSFRNTIDSFIRALAALLAIVVSFNILALRNEMKSMYTNIEEFDKQQKKMENLLKPLLTANIKDNTNVDVNRHYTYSVLRHAIMDATYAMRNMIIAANNKAEKILRTNTIDVSSSNKRFLNKDIQTLCKDFIQESQSALSLYAKFGSLYSLFSFSTISFVRRFPKFDVNKDKDNDYDNNDSTIINNIPKDEELRDFYNTIKYLDILKNICIKVYVRNTLTSLAIEMLAFTIPIIIFAAILGSNPAIYFHGESIRDILRILYAIGMSVIIFPFELLLVRSVPVLYLMMKNSSALPFSHM